MKHAEKVTPIAAAFTSLATLACCLPMGFAAAAASIAAALMAQLNELNAEQLDYKGLTLERHRLVARLAEISAS